ncbi:hypothetical protein BD626DRAFT_449908 [Schizophyllum amplum]|uniref:non-specific serine/threonine protein kinase n=1 Tax=Schizophyllum amplum TaxID=97359 RepID=A0A550CSR0_9AGAR|nr:hypothetical protein BD626DRAFT_449908 [Auriculariopsis ampla]
MFRRLLSFRLTQQDRPEWAQLDYDLTKLCKECKSFVIPKVDILRIVSMTVEGTSSEDTNASQAVAALCSVDLLRIEHDEEVVERIRKAANDLDPQNTFGILERLEQHILDLQLAHSKPVRIWRDDVHALVQEIVAPQVVSWMDDDTDDAMFVRRALREVQLRLRKEKTPQTTVERIAVAQRLARFACVLSQCDGTDCASHVNAATSCIPKLFPALANLCDGPEEVITSQLKKAVLDALSHFLKHHACDSVDSLEQPTHTVVYGLVDRDRGVRMASGRALKSLLAVYHAGGMASRQKMTPLFVELSRIAEQGKAPLTETLILSVCSAAKSASSEITGQGLCFLIAQLARQNPMVRGMAFTQIQSLAEFHKKSTYALFMAHNELITPYVIFRLCSQPDLIVETCKVLAIQQGDFINVAIPRTLHFLFAACETKVLEILERKIGVALHYLYVTNATEILAQIFRAPTVQDTQRAIHLVVSICKKGAQGDDAEKIDSFMVVKSHAVSVLSDLVVDLGSEMEEARELALDALKRLQTHLREDKSELHVFLKNNMLGHVSNVGGMLQDAKGKKNVEDKRRILRSLGTFINYVGEAVRFIAPQIMACYQSVIMVPELSEATLESWSSFLHAIQWKDIGSVIGTTSSTFVLGWPSFSERARGIALDALEYMVPNGENSLGDALNECADCGGIDELKNVHLRLQRLRLHLSSSERLRAILSRAVSLNMTVATQGLLEFKAFAVHPGNRPFLTRLSSGDMFDALVGRTLSALITAACRDGEDTGQLRLLAFECIGIIGAMDPDRCELPLTETSMIVMKNFNDEDEAIAFIMHLLQNLLVVTFSTATDSKHQTQIAFIIQELMKICKFTPGLVALGRGQAVALKVRNRWNSLPKFVVDAVMPYLEGRLSLGAPNILDTQKPATDVGLELPLYPRQSTYREWMQKWVYHLITKVSQGMAHKIFSVFRYCVNQNDAVIAHHLLPHLVLNVLISGASEDVDAVMQEIVLVLEDLSDQSSTSTPEKRLLSTQAVFMLLDHLNKWVRLTRQGILNRKKLEPRKGRSDGATQEEEWLVRVDSTLSIIDENLMAVAALESKSYARALMGFERLTRTLRERDAAHPDLPAYYERMHELYSHLDEPDGMEGVSSLILSPSLEHQIREHESTGRWTSAQSCWEVRLQQSPDNINFHLGLLRSLRNLGHYDTLRTHVRGVLVRHPEWESALAGYAVESAWMVGAWDDVASLTEQTTSDAPQLLIANVILAMRADDFTKVNAALEAARAALGRSVVAAGVTGYRRSYESTLDLHMTRELELIYRTSKENDSTRRRQHMQNLTSELSSRLDSTLPAFRIREPILSMRRAAFSMGSKHSAMIGDQIGRLWLSSAKIARKAGQWQTAYSALLQAQQNKAPYSFIESAKYVKATGDPLRALQELENSMKLMGILEENMYDLTVDQSELKMIKAKAHLLRARWINESDRYDVGTIQKVFSKATDMNPHWESVQFRLGQFHDSCFKSVLETNPRMASKQSRMLFHVVKAFAKAMRYGSKYIYQTVPRLLTIWLDTGENPEVLANWSTQKQKGEPVIVEAFRDMNTHVADAIKKVPTYKWYTAFPQIVSRIGLQNDTAYEMLADLISRVISEYPNQTLWLFTSAVKSKQGQRKMRGRELMSKLRNDPTNAHTKLSDLIVKSELMTTHLLGLCEYRVEDKGVSSLSMSRHFPDLHKIGCSNLIIPLQESMIASLPPASSDDASHRPFADDLPTFNGFNDEIDVMQTLAKPRKITIRGSNGQIYMFLGKPKDDLRKDARLMDLFSIINKLFKANSESRRRQLHIRTYGVVTLNEECGFIQWVPNTTPVRPILQKLYGARGIPSWYNEFAKIFETIQQQPKEAGRLFRDYILVKYPPVFHEWFLETFPEPTAWLTSRLNYSHTTAVMSMVGYVLGLGDRHLENILLDIVTGHAIHVDFNCLFEKGKTLTVAEVVPFRLTQNMVDGMGVAGVEGFYRIACEVTMDILRNNKDPIMSVLDAFIHDPLVEWEERKRSLDRKQELQRKNVNAVKAKTDLNALARNSLNLIGRKLRGELPEKKESPVWKEVSTGKLVQTLIEESTSPQNLGRMYFGWCPWH